MYVALLNFIETRGVYLALETVKSVQNKTIILGNNINDTDAMGIY